MMRIGNKCCEFKKFLKFSERYVISFLRLDRIRNTFTAWIEEKVFNADHSNPQYLPNYSSYFIRVYTFIKKKSCEKNITLLHVPYDRLERNSLLYRIFQATSDTRHPIAVSFRNR